MQQLCSHQGRTQSKRRCGLCPTLICQFSLIVNIKICLNIFICPMFKTILVLPLFTPCFYKRRRNRDKKSMPKQWRLKLDTKQVHATTLSFPLFSASSSSLPFAFLQPSLTFFEFQAMDRKRKIASTLQQKDSLMSIKQEFQSLQRSNISLRPDPRKTQILVYKNTHYDSRE